MADMEGQSRSTAGLSQLENKIQELEDCLRNEERYSATDRKHAAVQSIFILHHILSHFFVCFITEYLKCF